MAHLQYLDELRLGSEHERQALLIRTGVPQAVTCYHVLVVGITLEETLVILRNTSCREKSEPEMAFFLGSVLEEGRIARNHMLSGRGLSFRTAHQQLITSRVLSAGISLLPEEAVTERDRVRLDQARELFRELQTSGPDALRSEMSEFTPWEQALISSTLSGLPEGHRRMALEAIRAAHRSGADSFFEALSSHQVLSRLHCIAQSGDL